MVYHLANNTPEDKCLHRNIHDDDDDDDDGSDSGGHGVDGDNLGNWQRNQDQNWYAVHLPVFLEEIEAVL